MITPPHTLDFLKTFNLNTKDFRHHLWGKSKQSVPIRFLSCEHLVKALATVSKHPDRLYGDLTGQDWKRIFLSEIKYRTYLTEGVFAIFPKWYNTYRSIVSVSSHYSV